MIGSLPSWAIPMIVFAPGGAVWALVAGGRPALLAATEALPDPRSFGAVGWAVTVFFILLGFVALGLTVVSSAMSLRDRLRGDKQPPTHKVEQPITTQEAVRFATHEELHDMKDELRRIHDSGESRRLSLEEKLVKLNDDERDRIGRVHARIDKLSEQISGQGTVLQLIASKLNLNLGGKG